MARQPRPSASASSTAGVSIDDVARHAGVSTATVSRALRRLPGVAAATRERVERAATDLDYSISPIAAGLASGRVRTVAVVTPYVGRWFFGEILRAAADVLGAEGYEIALYVMDARRSRQQFFSDLPPRGRAGAVLLIGFPVTPSERRRLTSLGVPVLVAGHIPGDLPAVGIDDEAAAALAVRHLLELGHRDVAMVCGDREDEEAFIVPRQRAEGAAAALAAAGLSLPRHRVADGHFTAAGGQVATEQILDAATEPPTAVFCQSDEMAFGAVRALRDRGLRVPQDVSVVGIDDHEHAGLWDLTTVAQSVPEQGRQAARLVLEAISGAQPLDPATSVHVPIRLVRRGSSASPRTATGAQIAGKG